MDEIQSTKSNKTAVFVWLLVSVGFLYFLISSLPSSSHRAATCNAVNADAETIACQYFDIYSSTQELSANTGANITFPIDHVEADEDSTLTVKDSATGHILFEEQAQFGIVEIAFKVPASHEVVVEWKSLGATRQATRLSFSDCEPELTVGNAYRVAGEKNFAVQVRFTCIVGGGDVTVQLFDGQSWAYIENTSVESDDFLILKDIKKSSNAKLRVKFVSDAENGNLARTIKLKFDNDPYVAPSSSPTPSASRSDSVASDESLTVEIPGQVIWGRNFRITAKASSAINAKCTIYKQYSRVVMGKASMVAGQMDSEVYAVWTSNDGRVVIVGVTVECDDGVAVRRGDATSHGFR